MELSHHLTSSCLLRCNIDTILLTGVKFQVLRAEIRSTTVAVFYAHAQSDRTACALAWALTVIYRYTANGVLLVHAAFVLFVVLGGFLVLRWRPLVWLHLPAVAWGAWIEFSGHICPLTPLEVSLRQAGGEAGYAGDFLAHYLVALLYPEALTQGLQFALGALVMILNVAVYLAVWRKTRRYATIHD